MISNCYRSEQFDRHESEVHYDGNPGRLMKLTEENSLYSVPGVSQT